MEQREQSQTACRLSYAESRQRKAIAKYGGATVATADMLTADKIQWSLGATIGRKFSKQFALNKQAQRVDYSATQEPAVPSESGEDSGGDNNGGGGNPGELEG